MIEIRPVRVADAAPLAEAYRANRSFLAPFEPVRPEAYFTPEYQRELIELAIDERRNGTGYRCVIVDEDRIVGMISLSTIVRGPAQSANLGYWVAEAVNGRGYATEAVRQMLRIAFDELGLHRVDAGTLPQNTASQRVLSRNGFERIGLARAYLYIAGSWQDHILFQRLVQSGESASDESDLRLRIRETG